MAKSAQKDFIPASFEGIAKRQPIVAKKLAALNARAEEFFKPVPATTCKKGSHYYLPTFGVMLCTDISKTEISGFGSIKTSKLEQVFLRNPGRQVFTDAKLKTSQLREISTPDDMEKIIDMLKKGENTLSPPVNNAMQKKMYVEGILQTGNPFMLADLVCKVFGKGMEKSQTGIAYVTEGNKALERLSAEYAVVMKMDYREALKKLSVTAGKPTSDDLDFGIGTSPYDLEVAPK